MPSAQSPTAVFTADSLAFDSSPDMWEIAVARADDSTATIRVPPDLCEEIVNAIAAYSTRIEVVYCGPPSGRPAK